MKCRSILLISLLISMTTQAQQFLRSELPTSVSTPWEIQYGPDGYLWLSEWGGVVSRVDPITGAKTIAFAAADYFAGSALEQNPVCTQFAIGQGTFGLALDPDFAISNPTYIYLVYSYNAGTAIAPFTRFKIEKITWDKTIQQATGSTAIVDSLPNGYDHFGGRLLAVKRNGINYLYFSAGDNGISEVNAPNCYVPLSANPNNLAQDPYAMNGKIHRFLTDGSIPQDNPVSGNSFYTRGHRNPQGLIYNSSADVLYDVEHGDRTDDEINILYPGMNYGWKTVRGYHGDNNYPGEDSIIANYIPHPAIPGDSLVAAFYSWCDTLQPPASPVTPVTWCTVAPSDGLFYSSTVIPEMTNSLLITSLKNGNTVTHEVYCFHLNPDGKSLVPSTPNQPNPVKYFEADEALNGRLRDIAISPDSAKIYLINNGGTTADKIIVYSLMNVSTEENTPLATAIHLYPVPADQYLRIESGLDLTEVTMKNYAGAEVLPRQSYIQTLDVSALEAGIYMLEFKTKQGRRIFKKVVIH